MNLKKELQNCEDEEDKQRIMYQAMHMMNKQLKLYQDLPRSWSKGSVLTHFKTSTMFKEKLSGIYIEKKEKQFCDQYYNNQ
jgi:hypothetical protein